MLFALTIGSVMAIKKALITAAGFGTRFLPITKTIQKEMLPVLNRPLIDYVVEDCIKAGIEEIIFIVSEHNIQVKHFYMENKRLEQYLHDRGKPELYRFVEPVHNGVRYTFIKQPDASQYGTAVPVRLAQEQLESEDAFLVFMGDDLIYDPDGSSEAAAMIDIFETTGAVGLVTCIEKPDSLLDKYGVAELEYRNGHPFLKRLIEKPTPGTAPSNLANISKYILTPAIFEIIDRQQANPQTGELYITDSINLLAKQAPVTIHTPRGQYLDGGYVAGWLQANLEMAKNHPAIKAELDAYIRENWK